MWRKTTEGETFTSPWGEGIPGWHTECVVMINKLFGDKIDIHAGGVDLKFPHHENEIAQSIALNNNYIANYWMHNGHININNVKMSKSLNNFILAKDFIKEHSANVIKLAFLSTNYRQPLNLTDKVFDEALIIDNKIKTVLKSANNELNIKNIHNIKEEKDSTFEKYMNDDFNTPNVITLLLSLVKDLNQEIRNKGNNILTLTNKILTITNILGLSYSMPEFTEKQKETYNNWIKAREDKDFALADTLREKLPLKSVIPPFVVPFSWMVTPISGSFVVVSTICPVRVSAFWAYIPTSERKRKQHSNKNCTNFHEEFFILIILRF